MKRKWMGITYGLIFVAFTMVWQGVPKVCRAYILPAEQIIQFMARNFKPFETVYIIHGVYDDSHGEKDTAVFYNEKIWIKSPNFYRAESMTPNTHEGVERDHRFRHFLIANKEQWLVRLLNQMGVNLKEVAYTRIDGVIAYRIGNKQASQPKILIEKERFLPLLLVYKASTMTSEITIHVRFNDYRKVEQGWYPFEITLSSDNAQVTRLIIDQLKVNIPIPVSVFSVQGKRSSEKEPDSAEDDRLRRIIEAFEEKYR